MKPDDLGPLVLEFFEPGGEDARHGEEEGEAGGGLPVEAGEEATRDRAPAAARPRNQGDRLPNPDPKTGGDAEAVEALRPTRSATAITRPIPMRDEAIT